MEVSRLIILGNGFDLAHGLKTKYSDFMHDYYSNIGHDWDDDFFKCNYSKFVFEGCKNLNSIIKHIEESKGKNSKISLDKKSIQFNQGIFISIKNYFFYSLSIKHSIENWVDIENEYFKTMLSILDRRKENSYEEIITLNTEMDMISKKFEEYLSKNVVNKISGCYNKDLNEIIFEPTIDSQDSAEFFFREFPLTYAQQSNIRISYSLNYSYPVRQKFFSTLVLNFNYTSTFDNLYNTDDNITIIDIHGSLDNIDNPINLGFGDEMSKRYGEIEDYNNNEYLRLMKSFAYSKTDNYKRLFDFIESNDFQVHIMGHSCGLSDRTLLNAIFENHRCKSIKVFYHETVKEDGTKKDNYSDIVMNISRHFNKKTMMRDKIVNKEYSQPLPQLKIKK